MPFYTYILLSLQNGDLYKGYTEDIETRLAFHNSGKVKYTSRYMPWKLIYYETYETRGEAMRREKFLKSGKDEKG